MSTNPSTRFFERKAVLVIISLEGIMTFILLVTGMVFPNTDFAYGQFFDQSDARSNVTNSSKFSLNSTTSEKSNVSGLVLLSQKLNNASFGYRVLEGQVK